jgi:hypothetical protein
MQEEVAVDIDDYMGEWMITQAVNAPEWAAFQVKERFRLTKNEKDKYWYVPLTAKLKNGPQARELQRLSNVRLKGQSAGGDLLVFTFEKVGKQRLDVQIDNHEHPAHGGPHGVDD